MSSTIQEYGERMHAHTHIRTHAHTRTHSHYGAMSSTIQDSGASMHARTHIRTHAHTHTHADTRTQTHWARTQTIIPKRLTHTTRLKTRTPHTRRHALNTQAHPRTPNATCQQHSPTTHADPCTFAGPMADTLLSHLLTLTHSHSLSLTLTHSHSLTLALTLSPLSLIYV